MNPTKGTIAIRVRTQGGIPFFRRAGVRFSREWTVIPLEQLDKERFSAIMAEKNLRVEELDEMPEDAPILKTRDELEEECKELRRRNAALEAKLAALEPGGSPGADYDSMSAADLLDLAKQREIELHSRRKADVVEALKAADRVGMEGAKA